MDRLLARWDHMQLETIREELSHWSTITAMFTVEWSFDGTPLFRIELQGDCAFTPRWSFTLRWNHSYHAQVHFRLAMNYKDMHLVSISSHEDEIDFSSSDSESDEPLEEESDDNFDFFTELVD